LKYLKGRYIGDPGEDGMILKWILKEIECEKVG
jgi:hypothetical protein